MGIVSSLIEFVFPRPRPRLNPYYYTPRGFQQTRVAQINQGRFARRNLTRNRLNQEWLSRAGRNYSIQTQARQNPSAQIELRRPFAPQAQVERGRPSLLSRLANSMFSTNYNGPMPSNAPKRAGSVNRFFGMGRRAVMFSRIMRR